MPLRVTDKIVIPDDDLEITFARGGGPGGQNVNKVESKVVLRYRARASTALPPAVKERFLARSTSRLTLDGDIVIHADRTRDREKNLTDAKQRLAAMIEAAVPAPIPRKATKPTRGSQRRRLADKARQGEKKRIRTTRGTDD